MATRVQMIATVLNDINHKITSGIANVSHPKEM
jgi:hypothetical protein